jgi:hypothetical protein
MSLRDGLNVYLDESDMIFVRNWKKDLVLIFLSMTNIDSFVCIH